MPKNTNPAAIPRESTAPSPMRDYRICRYLLCLLLTPTTAFAQPLCDAATLQSATSTFEVGRFDRTFAVLQPCMPAGFAEKDLTIGAYRLLALSFIARDSLEMARQSIRQLLREDSQFRANPSTDPPPFVQLVDELRPPWYAWLWRGNEWYKWAGRGAIVGTAVALPILLKDDPRPELPSFPPFPQ